MQNTAQPWLAYTLTDSALLLSITSALQFAPVLLFSLFAGTVIDMFPRKSILLLTQTASLIITLVLAILVATKTVLYWHILVTAFLLGIVNTFDMPARQAFIIELVGKVDLMNAVALNSSVFNIAMIVGPAIAGIVMGTWGMAFCFFSNAVGYGAVLVGLLFIKPVFSQHRQKADGTVLLQMKDSFKYIGQNRILLKTIFTTAIMGTFAMNFRVLLPVFAKEILNLQETGFGLLMSLMGIGSFIGAMLLATMSKAEPKTSIINIFPAVIAVFLIITSFTRVYEQTALCLVAMGFFFVSFSSTANSTLMYYTKDEYRGRVMSVYTMVLGGASPIGNLYAGAITDRFGSRAGFLACGIIILFLLLFMYLYRHKFQFQK